MIPELDRLKGLMDPAEIMTMQASQAKVELAKHAEKAELEAALAAKVEQYCSSDHGADGFVRSADFRSLVNDNDALLRKKSNLPKQAHEVLTRRWPLEVAEYLINGQTIAERRREADERRRLAHITAMLDGGAQ